MCLLFSSWVDYIYHHIKDSVSPHMSFFLDSRIKGNTDTDKSKQVKKNIGSNSGFDVSLMCEMYLSLTTLHQRKDKMKDD